MLARFIGCVSIAALSAAACAGGEDLFGGRGASGQGGSGGAVSSGSDGGGGRDATSTGNGMGGEAPSASSSSSSSGGSDCPSHGRDDECIACAKIHCCPQFKACSSDVNCKCWVECQEEGHSSFTCQNMCGAQGNAYQAFHLCISSSCFFNCF